MAAAAILLAPPRAAAVTVTAHSHHDVNTINCATVISAEAIRCFHQPHLLLTPGAGGADTVWLSANDNGVAVGQKVFSNGLSDFTLYDGRHPRDVSKSLGGPGNFVSVDQLGGAAGTIYRHGDPFPFYFNSKSGKKASLPIPGRATGGTIGPMVAVTFNNGMAGVWNPELNKLAQFGPFTTTGINAAGIVAGDLPNGDIGLGFPTGLGGVQLQDLGIKGNATHITNWNVVTGYMEQGKRLTPITYNLGTNQLTKYRLPPGFRLGSLTGMSDTGKYAYGNVFKNQRALKLSQSIPIIWRNPLHPRPLVGPHIPFMSHGRYGALTTVTNIGITTGEISMRGREIGFIGFPPPFEKLEDLEEMAEEIFSEALEQEVGEALSRLGHLLDRGRVSRVCAGVRKLGTKLNVEAEDLEAAGGFFAGEDIALYDDMVDGLMDFGWEVGCPPLALPLAAPTALQFPYALAPVG